MISKKSSRSLKRRKQPSAKSVSSNTVVKGTRKKQSETLRVTVELEITVGSLIEKHAKSQGQAIEDFLVTAALQQFHNEQHRIEQKRKAGRDFLNYLMGRKSEVADDALESLTKGRQDNERRF
jgi:uncharacterized protein (DUF1778 family)